MPVYNESSNIEEVVADWKAEIKRVGIDDFEFVLVDDGSTDDTLDKLKQLSAQDPRIKTFSKDNSGHGQTCIFGYKKAIELEPEWILQIDSDGQCDPLFFAEFWQSRVDGKAVLGFRWQRDDGFSRLLISRALSLTMFLMSGKWLKDVNVPYRLMDFPTLEKVMRMVPDDFDLINTLLSYIYATKYDIVWAPIIFRRRTSGESSLNLGRIIKMGIKMVGQLAAFKVAG